MNTYNFIPYPEFHAEGGPVGCLASEFAADLPALQRLALPPGRKILLLVADGKQISNDDFHHLALQWLEAGVIYFCVWGPDCERLHDLFDEAYLEGSHTANYVNRRTDRPFIMTTWHSGWTLDEMLEFFLKSAFPADENEENGTDYKAIGGVSCIDISLGKEEWQEAIEQGLSNLAGTI